MMIAIIDYDAGNIKSVEKAVAYLGEEAIVTRDKNTILSADKVILPGVGAFGDAMQKLENYGLVEVIKEVVSKNTPFMGICLGLQLMFESSEETPDVKGLGLLKGKVVRIPDSEGLTVPQIGWNNLKVKPGTRLLANLPEDPYVYFVHSYYLNATDKEIVAATTEYSTTLDVAVESGNVFATQFHPEKSSEVGLKILENFIKL